MKISKRGEDFIKSWEKLRLRAYDDGAGVMTIGWGHAMSRAEQANMVQPISPQMAEEMFQSDVDKAEVPLLRDLATPGFASLGQNQYDVLVSFIFNVGGGNYKGSTLRKMLLSGDAKIEGQFARWVYGGGKIMRGLQRRRAAEAALYATPDVRDV